MTSEIPGAQQPADGTRPTTQTTITELSRPIERLQLVGVSAVVFFHAPGAGGSTLAESFADLLGLDEDHFFDGGKELRSRTGNTAGTTEFMDREHAVDEDIDEIQLRLMREASPENPVVINAKLGGYNAIRLMRENPGIEVIPVLVTCDRKVAARRMMRRKEGEVAAKFEKITAEVDEGLITTEQFSALMDALYEESENNTVDNILRRTQERVRKDMAKFSQIYPELEGLDLYNPDTRFGLEETVNPKTGKQVQVKGRFYRFQISTTHKNQQEALDTLVVELIKRGEAEKVKHQPDPNPIAQANIQPSDNGHKATV